MFAEALVGGAGFFGEGLDFGPQTLVYFLDAVARLYGQLVDVTREFIELALGIAPQLFVLCGALRPFRR
jgi:hypothetical protein